MLKIAIKLDGKSSEATKMPPYWKMPKGYPLGGTLGGISYVFRATHGRGRGSNYNRPDNHYVYFQHEGEWWFVYTGREWPAEPAIHIEDTNK